MICPECCSKFKEVVWENSEAISYTCSNCKLRICVNKRNNSVQMLRTPYAFHDWRELNSDEMKALNNDGEKVIFT